MKSETKKKKEREKEAKYIAILNAAESVLKAESLADLSINKVARKAKIAKGTVYLYFESKEEIIGELTIRARKKLLEYFIKYCDRQTDPIEKIKNIFWADYYFYKEHHTYHELVAFYEQKTGLKESAELAEAAFAIAVYVEKIIEDAKSKKLIRQEIESRVQGYIFWGMVVGVLQIINTKKGKFQKYFGKSEKEFYKYFVESTVEGLRT